MRMVRGRKEIGYLVQSWTASGQTDIYEDRKKESRLKTVERKAWSMKNNTNIIYAHART
jgi:hypothetical protein